MWLLTRVNSILHINNEQRIAHRAILNTVETTRKIRIGQRIESIEIRF